MNGGEEETRRLHTALKVSVFVFLPPSCKTGTEYCSRGYQARRGISRFLFSFFIIISALVFTKPTQLTHPVEKIPSFPEVYRFDEK